MPEGLNEGGKILGMPRKVAIPVLGVAVIAVVYVVIRSRSNVQGAVPRAAPEEGFAGGGGGGYSPAIGAVENAPPVNPLQTQLDKLYFEREQFQYNVAQRQEGERQSNWELKHEEDRSTVDAFLNLLPFQLETQKSHEGAEQAGYAAEEKRQGYLGEVYNTAAAGEKVVQRSIGGKSKVECPVGMHFVVNDQGGGQCQPLGGGGFSFKTIFAGAGNAMEAITKGVADVITGAGKGAARGAEAGAEQYVKSYIGGGVQKSGTGRRSASVGNANGSDASTDPINATPYRFAGSPDLSYPGLS